MRRARRRGLGLVGARALIVACTMPLTACVMVIGAPMGLVGGAPGDLEEVVVDGEGKTKVLLVDVAGVISDVPEQRAFGLVERESMVARVEAELERAAEDDRVRGVLVHVRSPGGAVAASDDVYQAIRRFATEQDVPVVTALGGVAASGGYYVACAGDVIVAHPAAITGSIGVIMVNLNVSGLLEKIGVQDATVTTGARKDMLSPFKVPDPAERALAEEVLGSLYERFLSVVRTRRPGLDEEALQTVRDGRIVDAERALALGLADRVGDLHAAVGVVRELVQDDDARIVRYRRPPEQAETLHAIGGAAARSTGTTALGDAAAWALEATGPRFLYLWMPASGLTRFATPR